MQPVQVLILELKTKSSWKETRKSDTRLRYKFKLSNAVYVIYANIVPYTACQIQSHRGNWWSQQFLLVPLQVTLISLAASTEHPSLQDTEMDTNNPILILTFPHHCGLLNTTHPYNPAELIKGCLD